MSISHVLVLLREFIQFSADIQPVLRELEFFQMSKNRIVSRKNLTIRNYN